MSQGENIIRLKKLEASGYRITNVKIPAGFRRSYFVLYTNIWHLHMESLTENITEAKLQCIALILC